ncbi:MAG: UPF0182 family protein [Microbacterium sp.]|uniref:UPF0182 family membrane protein n=1 Tax=Microbacterium sp. TaxID=51671 RepID=UPI0026240A98|nr:UPF0182 family protein [Microbacterium sp.]MCX6501302.1 UPF0182 family protein [Microbacterium sp.]
MTSTPAPTPAAPNRSRRIIAISLAVIAALVVAFFIFANLYADWLWYDQLGYTGVLLTQWLARAAMFVVGFLAMGIPVWVVIQLAYRLRPVYVRLSSQLDRYQEVVEPLRRLAMWGIPVFFGFFAGFAASAQWETTALWLNGVSTDTTDAQFGLDTGFYLFGLPFYGGVLGFASAVVLVCLLVTALVSYLYGSVHVGQRELRISKAARIQLAIIAGVYLLLQAASLWVDRYRTLTEAGDRITGPAYTGVNATIPGLTILAIVAALVAVLFFVTAVIGRWRYPLIATALLVVTSIVVGVVYPWIVNTVQVKPNQFAYESEYYERNLDATKTAFGIADMDTMDYDATTTVEAGQLRSDAETTASIRIMDPAIITPTIRQLQQYRSYYQFSTPLDVDRYQIDGQTQDTVVSVRDLNTTALGADASWQNSTLVYTHGYGLVVAKGNERTVDGDPVFIESGIPASGFLSSSDFEPRIYFGENSPVYSIVGAPEGKNPIELDYPSGAEGASETKTTFEGDGGPDIGNLFNRLIYALKFQSEQIVFSDYLNEDSQILYDRDPASRVQKVAPYLTLDSDPYPSVVDGRIVWIVDGYTTTDDYPYSTATSMSQAIEDANNENPQIALDNVNYIRNSVKATVDAYDGSVTLYAWDDEDPLLQAWQKVFPATLKSVEDMSADLISHVRYPTDLFKVQRAMLGVYHVDDAQSFFQQDNAWATPADPQSSDETVNQPPYYLTMKMPGQDAPTYSMFTSFIPRSSGTESRNVLMGYLAVDSDAGSQAGVKSEDYGKLRLLEIDSDSTVPGPGQVQNTFNSDPSISAQLNILKQGQSEVLNGNLLTLPVGGGFLYVQPVFVQASGGTQLPQLQKVLVAFGSQVAFENTLNEALDALFGGDSGASTGDAEVVPEDDAGTGTDTGTDGGDGGTVVPTDEYQAALEEARQALLDRQTALQGADWTAYGEADQRLQDAVNKLLELDGGQ